MTRARALQVLLVLVGLLFSAAIIPIATSLWNEKHAEYGSMMLSLYFALGIFLLLAARDPSAHRSLIAFAAWSSFAHAAVMTVQSLRDVSERVHLLGGSAMFVLIGVAFIALAPKKQAAERTSAVGE